METLETSRGVYGFPEPHIFLKKPCRTFEKPLKTSKEPLNVLVELLRVVQKLVLEALAIDLCRNPKKNVWAWLVKLRVPHLVVSCS